MKVTMSAPTGHVPEDSDSAGLGWDPGISSIASVSWDCAEQADCKTLTNIIKLKSFFGFC